MKETDRDLLDFNNDETQNNDDETPNNFPDTNAEKIGYAAYVTAKSLEHISPALRRLFRCESICKLNAPNIIINNECRMALKYLSRVKRDIDDASEEVHSVYMRTKEHKQG